MRFLERKLRRPPGLCQTPSAAPSHPKPATQAENPKRHVSALPKSRRSLHLPRVPPLPPREVPLARCLSISMATRLGRSARFSPRPTQPASDPSPHTHPAASALFSTTADSAGLSDEAPARSRASSGFCAPWTPPRAVPSGLCSAPPSGVASSHVLAPH